MNESMPASELLEAAARLIERALGQLDVTEEERCRSCGLRKFTKKNEARVHENLLALPSRLRNSAGRLRGDGPASVSLTE